MDNDLIKEVSTTLGLNKESVENVLMLLKEGATVPFIARYRKEKTGGLDEGVIREINLKYEYSVNLKEKKEDVKRLIDEKGLLTEELVKEIDASSKLVELDDIYRPFKEKKKTKATTAIKNGLEPLAKTILTFPKEGSLDSLAKDYLNESVKTIEEALEGAGYIIAEYISDDAEYRKYIRKYIFKNGSIKTKEVKSHSDAKKVYEIYYSFNEAINKIKPHRTLAINRAEKEKVITVSLDFSSDDIVLYLEEKIIKNNSFVNSLVRDAIKDALKRLIFPSVEREIRSELKDDATEKSIENFSENLKNLIMQRPLKEKRVLGFDPAFRTGCKLAAVDEFGALLEVSVIYPHEPQKEIEKSRKQLKELIIKHKIDIIAIGNGTASRESEVFVSEFLKSEKLNVEFVIVNEAGASVYSASTLAKEEFPTLQVEERSAVSIARRLQDPLNELVKIDPMSIGVGQYQHDMPPKLLRESLEFTVLSSVNNVGVNINTASISILSYISGLTKSVSKKIIDYRKKKGKITSRAELKTILSEKVYEQAIGFLRIIGGISPLDETNIHPESYTIAKEVLNSYNLKEEDIGSEGINKINFKNTFDLDNFTFSDIIDSFKMPKRDPRDDYDAPILKSDVLTITDLKEGMELEGVVRNVIDFGAFIDIGLENDALVHVSKIAKRYITHPSEVLAVGDIVKCYIIAVDKEKGRVSLSLFKE